jgi:hypothetical protein
MRGTRRCCSSLSSFDGLALRQRVVTAERSTPPRKQCRLLSSANDTTSTPEAIAAREKILRATFLKTQAIPPHGLFPWRHDERPLERLIPGTFDFDEKGQLLGGNVASSNPSLDAFVTAYMFLGIPWYEIPFFRQYKSDLANSMAWAFARAVSGMLSNVYHGTLVRPHGKIKIGGNTFSRRDVVPFSVWKKIRWQNLTPVFCRRYFTPQYLAMIPPRATFMSIFHIPYQTKPRRTTTKMLLAATKKHYPM